MTFFVIFLIGTKEEARQARERMEQEGNAVDLRTYIKLHAYVHASSDELQRLGDIDPEIRRMIDLLPVGEARMFSDIFDPNKQTVHYKDARGNLKKVDINPERISEFSDDEKSGVELGLSQKLKDLGFKFSDAGDNMYTLDRLIDQTRKILLKQETDSVEFAF